MTPTPCGTPSSRTRARSRRSSSSPSRPTPGLILPAPGFLETMRELCTAHGALLIFDEVMTGFRLARGGAQELLGIRPDLSCFGKVIGGGLPVGAFGGRADIMDFLAPLGPVYQAGTLSGNPLAMAAGLAQLKVLEEQNIFAKLEKLGAQLETETRAALKSAGLDYVLLSNRLDVLPLLHRKSPSGIWMTPRRPTSNISRVSFTPCWRREFISRRRNSKRDSSAPRTPRRISTQTCQACAKSLGRELTLKQRSQRRARADQFQRIGAQVAQAIQDYSRSARGSASPRRSAQSNRPFKVASVPSTSPEACASRIASSNKRAPVAIISWTSNRMRSSCVQISEPSVKEDNRASGRFPRRP